ncbi:TetR/AcrR family transcriptional regulator [Streptomyces silaceus]|uniref:TetR/AcrR family transcriptional regulator n=1 Tax=Streptomyces silaceus TaxID=545123 RepID=UPI0006EBC06B|nr:TetR/AcrR family transcriptional regulator [Streptomyces silaceus]
MPTPQSRRERPAKPALTREGIIDTAVSLMEREGLQRVTMRRLAQALDTGPASLYVYVANTAELHGEILDRLLGRVELDSSPVGADWRTRLDAVLASYEEVLFAHPALAQSALSARPSGDNYLTLLDTLLALLAEGGVPDRQAAWGVDLLLQSATSSAAEHSARREDSRAEQDWARLRQNLAEASPEVHPHVRAQAGNLVSGTPSERRLWSVNMLVNGIQSTPVTVEATADGTSGE